METLDLQALAGFATFNRIGCTSVNRDGRSPLLFAVFSSRADIVHELLERGVDVEAGTFVKGLGQATPLMLAARGGDLALVEALLAAGADPRWTNESGATATSRARDAGKTDVVARLEQAAAPETRQTAPASRR